MSDGLSDANAVAAIANAIEDAAHDLRDALDAATEGHRGLTVDPILIVNEALKRSGYMLTKERTNG
jgi:hypothetical protein